jgi:hypothetical protein
VHIKSTKKHAEETEGTDSRNQSGLGTWSSKDLLNALLAPAIFLCLTVFATFSLISPPGLIIGWDWPFPPYREAVSSDALRYAWSGLSDQTVERGGFSRGLAERIFEAIVPVDPSALTKLYVFLVIWISGLSLYFLLRKNGASRFQGFVGGFAYMFSIWLYERIVTGDIVSMVAYSLLPLCFYLFTLREASLRLRIRNLLLLGLLMSLGDYISTVIVATVLLLYGIFDSVLSRSFRRLAGYCGTIFLDLGFVALTNFTYLLPTLLQGQAPTVPTSVSLSDLFIRSLNSQIINVLTQIASPYNPSLFWELVSENHSLYPLWLPVSFLIVSLVFLAILVQGKNRMVLFAGVLALFSLALSTGVNPPAGWINVWLYENVSYFRIFRDPNKWSMLAAFAYGILLSYVAGFLPSFAGGFGHQVACVPNLKFKLLRLARASLICALICSLVIYSWLPLTGTYDHDLMTVDFPKEYRATYDWLKTEPGDFRVLWLPADPYTQYDWIPFSYQQRDAIAAYSPKQDFMSHELGDNYGRFSYFVAYLLYHRDYRAVDISRILALSGVKYVLVRNDALPWWWQSLGYDEKTMISLLKGQRGLHLIRSFGPIDVYLNEEYKDQWRITMSDGIALVNGGPALLSVLSKIPDDMLEKYPLVFADQVQMNTGLSDLEPSVKAIYSVNDNDLGFAFSYLPSQFVIDASNYAMNGNPSYGWAQLYGSNYWYLNYDFLDTTVDSAITNSTALLNIPISTNSSEPYQLWAKIFYGPTSSALEFSLDGMHIGGIEEARSSSRSEYEWVRIGEVPVQKGIHVVSVQSDGLGINLISKIAFAPTPLINRAFATAQADLESKDIMMIYTSNDLINSWQLVGKCVDLPRTGSYDILAHVPGNLTSVRVNVDQSQFAVSSLKESGWFVIPGVNMTKGGHCVRVSSLQSVDLLVLRSTEKGAQTGEVSYVEIDPTSYAVQVNSCNPCFLSFHDAYNTGWVAFSGNNSYESIPVYSAFDGFWINGSANAKLDLIFSKQVYFSIGLYVSIATIVAALAFLLFGVATEAFGTERFTLRNKRQFSRTSPHS